jgi:hypothetical protein
MSNFSGKIKVNIGVLGHIDSGKTSLCGALSTILSTAALDKNPQARLSFLYLSLPVFELLLWSHGNFTTFHKNL